MRVGGAGCRGRGRGLENSHPPETLARGQGSAGRRGFFFSELHLRQGARDLDSNKSPLPRARPFLCGSFSVNFRAVDFLSFRFFCQASDFRTPALARLASHRQAHPDGWSRTRPLSQVSNSPTQRDLKSQVAASTTQQPDGVESSRVIPGPLESHVTSRRTRHQDHPGHAVPLVKSRFLESQVTVQPSLGSIAAPFGPSLNKSQGSQVPPHPSRPRPFEPFLCGLQSCPGHAALTFLSGWLIESPRPPPPWLPPCPASLQENSLTATSRRPDSSRPRGLCTARSDWGPNMCVSSSSISPDPYLAGSQVHQSSDPDQDRIPMQGPGCTTMRSLCPLRQR